MQTYCSWPRRGYVSGQAQAEATSRTLQPDGQIDGDVPNGTERKEWDKRKPALLKRTIYVNDVMRNGHVRLLEGDLAADVHETDTRRVLKAAKGGTKRPHDVRDESAAKKKATRSAAE